MAIGARALLLIVIGAYAASLICQLQGKGSAAARARNIHVLM
jgi:hypothetical protein